MCFHACEALRPLTLLTLGAASSLLRDGQGPPRAGGAGPGVTSHPGIFTFTLPTAAVGPPSQILVEAAGRRRWETVTCVICVYL